MLGTSKPSGHYMYGTVVTICTSQWSLYVPPVKHSTILLSAHTVYLCVLCGSENKQWLFPYTALTETGFYNRDEECLLRGTNWNSISTNKCTILFFHSTLHTRQSSTQNNKYRVSHKHNCFSWWWAHSSPKHVEIDKYTKNKLCTS